MKRGHSSAGFGPVKGHRDWEWLPYPGHFICSSRCRFRMATIVGKQGGTRYLVSTIGQFIQNFGDKEPTMIGSDRHFETMAFPFDPVDNAPSDWSGYMEQALGDQDASEQAVIGHYAACWKWHRKSLSGEKA